MILIQSFDEKLDWRAKLCPNVSNLIQASVVQWKGWRGLKFRRKNWIEEQNFVRTIKIV